jgi:hypothetical protein
LVSTYFQQILDILRFFSQMALLSTQTEFKGNFESMSLYRHKALFQPQANRAKKQTFSNLAKRGNVLSLCGANLLLLSSLAKRDDVLSLCAIKRQGLGLRSAPLLPPPTYI